MRHPGVSADGKTLWGGGLLSLLKTQDTGYYFDVEISNGGGLQDVKIIPGNPDFAAVATAIALGQIWIIYPKRIDPATGKPGVAELLFDLGPEARETTAIFSALTNDGKYMYVTYTTGNHVAALDISDLNNIRRLDDPNEAQPITGPHYFKITPDGKQVVVTGYFVQTGDIGFLNTPSDYKAHYIDILDDGSLSFNRTIDFPSVFPERGGARPHSTVVFDLTDPANRKYDSQADRNAPSGI
ncbi:putative quinoprotein amine dehydrogenase, beta chain [Septoria linicola]|nr:putative quinoprotein amine dehydrogenase, beta chain [Septoria linicola]